MKYFRHILMAHEIFFKIFERSQNIFLCFIFVILIFKFLGLDHKMSKLAIKEIYKRQAMLNKSHLLSRDKANIGKNIWWKVKCFYHYLPYICWVDVIYLTCLAFLKSPIRQIVVKKSASCILTLMPGSLSLPIDTRYKFVTNFLQ